MSRKQRRVFMLGVVTILASTCSMVFPQKADAQGAARPASLSFYLRWKGNDNRVRPIQGAGVRLVNSAGRVIASGTTNSSGNYLCQAIPKQGPFLIQVTYNGQTRVYGYPQPPTQFPNRPNDRYHQSRVFNSPTGY